MSDHTDPLARVAIDPGLQQAFRAELHGLPINVPEARLRATLRRGARRQPDKEQRGQ
ncbi:MAG: hypothetical protein AAGA81_13575 [Acidobacteriota bacterium]